MQIDVGKAEVDVNGKRIMVNSVRVNDKVTVVTGKILKTAKLKDEWYEDIEHPDVIIKSLINANVKADIFTFWQRLPETQPKFSYYMEWQSVSALPVTSYDNWWEKQIHDKTKKNIKKSSKRGVVIKLVDFNDDFVRGVSEIYNERPIRRGKPFRHYGKDFNTIKRELSIDLHRSSFIGAYYNDELIGFYQLLYDDRLAHPVLSLSSEAHRERKADDALLSKAMELCVDKNIAFLMYGPWRRGSHAEFLKRHGFEKFDVPRYYVPLTIKGKLIMALKLHRGIVALLPEKIKIMLLDLRAKWFEAKYKKQENNEEQ